MTDEPKLPTPDKTPWPISKAALIRGHKRACLSDAKKYPPEISSAMTLEHAAGGCNECLFVLVGYIGALDPTKRTEIFRIFLKDMANPNVKLDDAGIRQYILWCAHEALLESFAIHDHTRGVIRRTMAKLGIVKEPNESMQDAFKRYGFVTINSDMIELRELEMLGGDFLESPQLFREWFEKNLVLPLIAHENDFLSKSKNKVILSYGAPQLYYDRFAEMFRLKTWETASFPVAKEPAEVNA